VSKVNSNRIEDKLRVREKGVTLLEVLVGFVIFTSSIVAVLDYVSQQIYLNNLSALTLHKAQLVYDLSVLSDLGVEQQVQIIKIPEINELNWTVTSSPMGSIQQRGGVLELNRYEYSVIDTNNGFEWTVIKLANKAQSVHD